MTGDSRRRADSIQPMDRVVRPARLRSDKRSRNAARSLDRAFGIDASIRLRCRDAAPAIRSAGAATPRQETVMLTAFGPLPLRSGSTSKATC